MHYEASCVFFPSLTTFGQIHVLKSMIRNELDFKNYCYNINDVGTSFIALSVSILAQSSPTHMSARQSPEACQFMFIDFKVANCVVT